MINLLTSVLLLAAGIDYSFAGPVPKINRGQISPIYSNTTAVSSNPISSIDSSFAVNPTSALASPTASLPILSGSTSRVSTSTLVPTSTEVQSFKADTAVIIEPIQRTVFTRIIPAITFLNPKGEPIASQDAQTILSTSFFTPTPVPAAPSKVSSAESASIQNSENVPGPSSSSTVPASSQTAVQGGPLTTTRSIPSFSYSPEESEPSVSIASSTSIVGSTASAPPPLASTTGSAGNVTSLPGFSHPGLASAGSTVVLASSIVANRSTAITKSALVESSTILQASPSRTTALSLTLPNTRGSISVSRIIVTKTEYTTVYRSTRSPAVSSAGPATSSMNGSELGGVSTSAPLQQSSSAPPVLPSTPLQPPPLVIVTQYTTVTPSVAASLPGPSAASSGPTGSAVASSITLVSSSIAAATSQPASPPVSSRAPEPPIESSGSRSSVLSPLSPPPAVTQPPPSPTPGAPPPPPAPPATTSEGPLVINPIPPSQIFTVTVTTTEKETVTETATVSVTVRA